MKAIVITEPGGPEKLELREVDDPKLGDNQVLLDVRATALNRADLLQRRGFYPAPPGESEILGLECAGVVRELGKGASAVKPGDRVMALLPGGGYAERVVIPDRMAIPIPDNLSFEEAAAIPEAFLTAREALFTLGQLEAGGSVLIHAAAGGVGSAAIQLARHHGSKVIATVGTDKKAERALELGAHVAINYRSQDFAEVAKAATNGQGVNVILDFVGGAYWEKHASCLAIGGRCVVIGVLGGATASVNLALLLMRRQQILGLVMRSRPVVDKIVITQRFIRESLHLFADQSLLPIVDSVLPLAEATKAHERMEANANVGKIVLSIASV
jgi:tumor protein p53-inducible protein 3